MLQQLQEKLDPVCRRQRLQARVAAALPVAFFAAGLAAGLALLGFLAGSVILKLAAAIVLIVGVAAASAFAFGVKRDWTSAARAVDSHFQLQDRSLTALASAAAASPRAAQELQLRDALERLSKVDTRAAASFEVDRRRLAITLVCTLATIVFVVWPSTPSNGNGTPEQIEAAKQKFQPRAVEFPDLAGGSAGKSIKFLAGSGKSQDPFSPPLRRHDEIATTAKIRQYFQAAVEANDSDL